MFEIEYDEIEEIFQNGDNMEIWKETDVVLGLNLLYTGWIKVWVAGDIYNACGGMCKKLVFPAQGVNTPS